MNTATRTTTSRKAMRVATVFTGAAAAAITFAPGALAAPGHAAQANGKAQAQAPAIQSRGCTNNTWLHIEYSSLFRTLCKQFGFAGKMVPKGGTLAMTAQCGGNNVGTIFWSTGHSLPYRQGTTYRSFSPFRVVSKVSILYWSGTEQCKWPR